MGPHAESSNSRNHLGLQPAPVSQILSYIVKRHSWPSTVIICSSRELWLAEHLVEIQNAPERDVDIEVQQDVIGEQETDQSLGLSLLIPTLSLLSQSQNIKIVFCPTLQTLHAYLATHQLECQTPNHSEKGRKSESRMAFPILCIINSLNLHADRMTSLSVQSLSIFFASAVEAAHRTGQTLIVVESHNDAARGRTPNSAAGSVAAGATVDFPFSPGVQPEQVSRLVADDMDHAMDLVSTAPNGQTLVDPWSRQVTILDIPTKKLVFGGQGGSERTVPIKDIAGRWLIFRKLQELDDLEPIS